VTICIVAIHDKIYRSWSIFVGQCNNTCKNEATLPLHRFEVDKIMDIKLINIGFGNIVSANRVVAIVSPESAPIKRIISDAREHGKLVDATYGRRTRAVIVTDSSHVVLSAIQPETVANRFVISKEGATD
jgi:regulator of extracellular matrix RemA (YlzA/DUF370 family)